MAQIIVCKDGLLLATHTPEQGLEAMTALYPGCEVVLRDGPHVHPTIDTGDPRQPGEPAPDPRSEEQKVADAKAAEIAAIKARHAAEAEAGVMLGNGWRMRFADEARANYAEVKQLIDLAGTSLSSVTIYDADSHAHTLTPAEATAILTEYARLVAVERQRQFAELAAAGW